MLRKIGHENKQQVTLTKIGISFCKGKCILGEKNWCLDI